MITQPTSPKGQVFNQIVPAGQTIPLQQRGTNAYVILSTGTLLMRGRGPRGINTYVTYPTGTGFENSEFDIVEIQNPNGFDITTSVWVGDASFIDKRLILNNQQLSNVVRPLYTDPTHAPAASVAIDDISGGAFFDINGKKWLAVSRVQILISNLDLVNLILLQKFGNAVWNTGAIFAVQPATEVGPAFGGSYTLVQNGGNVNALVVEIYQSIPA
jgi:hypothetical protein